MRILDRKRFGLPADPWKPIRIDTADAARIAVAVNAAIDTQAWVSLVGPRGVGKTWAVRAAMARYPGLQVVAPLRLARERLHVGDIETAIILTLSDQRPRRAAEMRSRQVRQVLGEASRDRPLIILIDDAHLLHHQTLRAIKRLRELEWCRRSPLVGIVLVGQQARADHIPEVGLRTDTLILAGLSAAEARQALTQSVGRVLDGDAIDALAESLQTRNWLDLQSLVDAVLAEAIVRGEAKISRATVQAVLVPSADTAGQADTAGSGCSTPLSVSHYLATRRSTERGAARAATGG